MSGIWAKSGAGSAASTVTPPSAAIEAGDVYFSADVETDGPIPGPYSMLSFALVPAGVFDGRRYQRPANYDDVFYAQLKPISERFDPEALAVNGLDREALINTGGDPATVMREASEWVSRCSPNGTPVLVAYPLSFDWSWLYWYFVRFHGSSPFKHSRCYDIKTAVAVKGFQTVTRSGRAGLPAELQSKRPHTHHAVDDAIAQAEIFSNVFEWEPGTKT